MIKTTDPMVLEGVRGLVPEDALGFDPDSLMENSFCLVSGDDVALFTEESPGVYAGHYFFRSRGRTALDIAEGFLRHMFSAEDAIVIKGLTPIDNKKAIWFTRRLGFEMLDVLDTSVGRLQLSMLTKKDYFNE